MKHPEIDKEENIVLVKRNVVDGYLILTYPFLKTRMSNLLFSS